MPGNNYFQKVLKKNMFVQMKDVKVDFQTVPYNTTRNIR